jgi:Phage integrase, N-terminal SAM-like domain
MRLCKCGCDLSLEGMRRPARTGQIVERPDATGAVRRSLRFRAGGRRHTVPLGVVSRVEAERELAFVMADVARGVWQPPRRVETTIVDVPTFHEFSEQWWVRNENQLAESTQLDYRWRLEKHLLPFFKDLALDAITFDMVEGYIAAKLAEDDGLSPRSINMTVTLLAAILESAVERELIARNPARARSAGRANAHRGAPISTQPRRSTRCSTPPASWTATHRRTSGMFAAARSSRR